MKKKIFSVIFATLLVAITAIVSSAVTIEFDLKEGKLSNVDADSTGVYKIVAVVKHPGHVFKGVHLETTFDSSVIVPVSSKSGSEANIAGGTVKTPLTLPKVSYYDADNEENVTEEASYTTNYPKWVAVADTTKYSVNFEAYTVSNKFAADELVIFEMYFKLAEGKSLSDIKVGTFVPTSVSFTGDDAQYYYQYKEYDDTMDVVNNVVPTSKPVVIPVKSGDVVYLQNGTTVKIAEDNAAYEIPSTDGTVVVNSTASGLQTAQKVYTVASGVVKEDSAKADGVIATGGASIRDDSVASGIRFKSTFLTALKGVVEEYGYITTVESAYNALPADYVLNMALVNSGKAVLGKAYADGGKTDIFSDVEGNKTVVTAVITNVPMTKEGVTTNIVTRPYYKLANGTVVYGESMTRTVYEVALNIKTNDAETYAKYKTYVDNIIKLVDVSEVIIDFGPLF